MPDQDRITLERLAEVGRYVVGHLDLEVVLRRVLETARELTGARYAALGILDERKAELERFVTSGVDEEVRRRIGDLPRGRGILGLLIRDPKPLRLRDIGEHPESYGFPVGHPPMRSFLGVPIVVRGEAWGNLYLTEKEDGEFDESDESALMTLADWAAVAIDNARLFQRAERRRAELEQAVSSLEATTAIARALGAETDLGRVLELIVKRARALVGARALAILLSEGDELSVAATAGELRPGVRGTVIPSEGSVPGHVLRTGHGARISDLAGRMERVLERLGIEATTALVVPLVYRSRPVGVIVAFDRTAPAPEFTAEDERLLEAFAASAATAVATAKSVEEQRLRRSLEAAEQERTRWARELHDETLQGLAALRLLLSSGVASGDPERLEQAARAAIDQLRIEVENLRSLITELRPASLDELGLASALRALADRTSSTESFTLDAQIDLAEGDDEAAARLTPELESTVYRLVQEALRNVVRHADAEHVELRVVERDGAVHVRVADDGRGFDPDAPVAGFGVLGMRERVALVDGTLEVSSRPGEGTTISAEIPIRRAREVSPGSAGAAA